MNKYVLLFFPFLLSLVSVQAATVQEAATSVVAQAPLVQAAVQSAAEFTQQHVSNERASRVMRGVAGLVGVFTAISSAILSPAMVTGLIAGTTSIASFVGFFVIPFVLIVCYIAYEMTRPTAQQLANMLPKSGFELVDKLIPNGTQIAWGLALKYVVQIVWNAIVKGSGNDPRSHDLAILGCMVFVVVTLYLVNKLIAKYAKHTGNSEDDYLFDYEPYKFAVDHVHYAVYAFAFLFAIRGFYNYSISKPRTHE